jgi:hypothetical protein
MMELRQGDRRAFFDVPFNVYRSEDGYVSPLRSDFFGCLMEQKTRYF